MVSSVCLSVSLLPLIIVTQDRLHMCILACFRDVNALAISVAPLQGDGTTAMEITEFQSPLTSIPLPSEGVILLGGAKSSEEVGSTLGDGFSGCLDRVVVNNAQLPLLHPNEMDHDLVTCMLR